MTKYRISDDESHFYWSNKFGWVGKYEADTFENTKSNLPSNGVWEEIPDYSNVAPKEKLIIEKALGTIFCGSTDDTSFYYELINCSTEEEYDEVCDHFEAYLWEPHEHATWEWVLEEVDNNYISCKHFATELEKLILNNR